MHRKCICFALLLLCMGCSICPPSPSKELIKSSDTVYSFFKDSIQCKEYGNAYEILSPETKKTISYEEFYLAFSHFFVLSRIVTGARVHSIQVHEDKSKGTLELCNDEFGFTHNFRIHYLLLKKDLGYWVMDLSHQELENLVEFAKDWYRYQQAQLGERKYAMPPWWRYKPFKPLAKAK